MKKTNTKTKTAKKQTSKCVLAKDRAGRFFAIPEAQAKQFLLPPKKAAAAKAIYESEVEGQSLYMGLVDPDDFGGSFIDAPGKAVVLDFKKKKK